MRFDIQREDLLKPLQHAMGVVERRQTLPILSNVRLQAHEGRISITATDLEVELIAETGSEVDEPGEVTVPARKFLDICRTLPEGAKVSMAVEGEKAIIRSGRSRFTLLTLPAADFPAVESVEPQRRFSVAQKVLKDLVERTGFAMAQQDVRYYLNGLLLEMENDRLRTVATDGHRLSLCEQPAEPGEGQLQQVIIPRKGVQELGRLLEDSEEAVTVEVSTNHIRLNLNDTRFTSKLIDGRFPDYTQVIPQRGDKTLVADREAMRQALTRTSILSNEKYRGVRLSLEDSKLRMQAHNPEQEEAEEELEVTYEGEPLEIGFNVTYVLDALGALQGEQLHMSLTDSNSSCLIQETDTDSCRYVIMPMRL